ncbi:MAG: TIGR03013 family PEP-CTERM/XrtA system glycosyltransferase [Candidatus Polarisedimenticolaceae bacterium]|nr:TIGR03013 family PEP-CTERM/XrtA system glycosyltransferase [Candidatus Polarisedimenticolaceae bacterium]
MVRILGYYIAKGFLILGFVEVLIFVTSVYISRYLGDHFGMPEVLLNDSLLLNTAFAFAVIMFVSVISLGLYQRGALASASGFIVRLGISFAIGGTAMAVLLFVFPNAFTSGRGLLALCLLISFPGVLTARALFVRFTSDDTRKRRVLVLGAGVNADRIEEVFAKDPSLGFVVVGYIPLQDKVTLIDEHRQIVKDQSLLEIAQRTDVDEIVIAVDDRRRRLPVDDLLQCKMSNFEVLDLLTFFEKELSIIKIDLLYPSWILNARGYNRSAVSRYVKRVFDILMSLILLVLCSPFMVMVSIASLIESRGKDPILYSQIRTGLYGAPFRVLKFRSMRTDAEADGVARWATKNDNRITPLGVLIRKTRLDELPQFFNVLRGDMSLVGPRPERPSFVEELEKDIPYYAERHWAKPGLTGWAQLLYPYAATKEDTKRKLEYDLYYVKNSGTVLDLMVIMQTIEVVLLGKGAH